MAGKVTVACMIPNGLILEVGSRSVIVEGSRNSPLLGGCGFTENVDKDFFEAWLSAHKELTFVKQGLIFAHDKTASAKDEAKDMKDEKSGLEPLDPSNKPKGITAETKD